MSEAKRVLVIDDEPDVLLLCRVNLEFEGYEVVGATDGVEGLEAARRVMPDIVLCDVMMPRMDGWQVLAAIKEDPRTADIPVIMLTARALEADQIRGWSGGAADYITKPFSPLQLSAVVADVIGNDPLEEERRRRDILGKLQMLRSI